MEKKWIKSTNDAGKVYKETLVCDDSFKYSDALIEFRGKCEVYTNKCTHIELTIVDELVDQPNVDNNAIGAKLDQVLDILGGSPIIPVNFNTSKKVHKKYLDYRFNELLYHIQELGDSLDGRWAMIDDINIADHESTTNITEHPDCQEQYTYSGDYKDNIESMLVEINDKLDVLKSLIGNIKSDARAETENKPKRTRGRKMSNNTDVAS